MTLYQLKQSIKSNNIPHGVIFYGEHIVFKEYVREVAKRLGVEPQLFPDVNAFNTLNVDLFGNEQVGYAVVDKLDPKAIQSILDTKENYKYVLLNEKPEDMTNIVEIPEISLVVEIERFERLYGVSKATTTYLVSVCKNYISALNIVEQAHNMSGDINENIYKCLEISAHRGELESVFAFSNAFVNHNYGKCIEMIKSGEYEPRTFLHILEQQFRFMLACVERPEFERTGMKNKSQYWNIIRNLRAGWNLDKIVRVLRNCLKVDEMICYGIAEPNLALELLVLKTATM